MKQRVLFVGLVWPEPEATAASVRILQLIAFFKFYNYEIAFCSASKKTALSADLKSQGLNEIQVTLNDSSFDKFIQEFNPDFVVFDRFLSEEQFGWRVEDCCPKAIKILDTEDLHFLRNHRKSKITSDFTSSDLAKREIASIYRCDLSLIISEFEMRLLKEKFHIPDSLLVYLPFMEVALKSDAYSHYPSFINRQHFISIGNFKHEPNWNAVLRLKKTIWPLIHKELPEAELHIYGAYTSEKVLNLHNESEGFLIKGWARNIEEVFTASRACLAPLEFGAGIKGKLLHSMKYGTPNITTAIGAEGMEIDKKWNGFIAGDWVEFAEKAILLYQNMNLWLKFQKNGLEIFNYRFASEHFYPNFKQILNNLSKNLDKHRSQNFIGAMLRHHSMRSTMFLSKYIELKNQD